MQAARVGCRDRMRVDDKVREALVGTVILGFAATDCGA